MNIRRTISLVVGIALLACAQASVSLAADTAAKPPALSKEQREKMANAHEKAATCLRSARPVTECRQEMMRACTDAMGADGCNMMSGGMMGGNMMHGQSSQGQPEAKKP
jgi:hypothetical protein